jgi:hypothetical protein
MTNLFYLDKNKYDIVWEKLKTCKSFNDILKLYENLSYLIQCPLYTHVTKLLHIDLDNFIRLDYGIELIKTAILFHDIGKLCTETLTKHSVYYIGHEIVSAHLYKRWLEYNSDILPFTYLEKRYVIPYVILNHTKAAYVNKKKYKNIMRGLGGYSYVLEWLHYLNHLNSNKIHKLDFISDTRIHFYRYGMPKINTDKKVIIILTGIPGAGKTTLRTQLAKEFSAVNINYDNYRKRNLALTITAREIFNIFKNHNKVNILMHDNTNINYQHYKQNLLLNFLNSKYNVYFINLDIPFDISLKRRNFDFDVLVSYHGRYTPSFMIYQAKGEHYLILKNLIKL